MNHFLAAMVGIAFASGASPASAQNLIGNGGFDTDLSGWVDGPLEPHGSSWSSSDCCGNGNSGSAHLLGSVFSTELDSACIAVSGATSYDFVVQINTLPSGSVGPAGASANLAWFSQENCTSQIDIQMMDLGNSQAWRQTGATFTSPSNAHAVMIQLVSVGGGLSNGTDAYFDDVRFGPPGTVPVTLQSFDID